MASRPNKRVNLVVARVIPPIVLGVIIYACYAFTKPLCIDYLIDPSTRYHRSRRVGTGAALIVIFYVLLIPVGVTYLRLLLKVLRNPDYLPRAAQPGQDQGEPRPSDRHRRRHHRRKSGSKSTEKTGRPDLDVERRTDLHSGGKAFPLDATGLESFYTKDVFVCQPDGRPPYCSTCCQFKTDRSHHCREVDRCVRKMDHFCPWVGGVVSESSFKFFIQFVIYAAFFCTYSLVVFAVFLAELKRETGLVNAHWAVGIALSGLFGLFSLGMTLSSLQLAINNLSTIENLNRTSAVWTLAVRVPDRILAQNTSGSQWTSTYRTITYPLQSMSPPSESREGPPPPTEPRHVFAILQTQPGENPFDLGSPIKNLQQIMGYTILEWLIPFKESPCTDHNSLESAFALGPVVARLRKEAGLEPADEGTDGDAPPENQSSHERSRGKHRRSN